MFLINRSSCQWRLQKEHPRVGATGRRNFLEDWSTTFQLPQQVHRGSAVVADGSLGTSAALWCAALLRHWSTLSINGAYVISSETNEHPILDVHVVIYHAWSVTSLTDAVHRCWNGKPTTASVFTAVMCCYNGMSKNLPDLCRTCCHSL